VGVRWNRVREYMASARDAARARTRLISAGPHHGSLNAVATEELQPGTPVKLHAFIERRDPLSGSYLVAVRPVTMGSRDPGPIEHVWVSSDELSVVEDGRGA
jgi:hypothetical protein